jgi:hypothetical protein
MLPRKQARDIQKRKKKQAATPGTKMPQKEKKNIIGNGLQEADRKRYWGTQRPPTPNHPPQPLPQLSISLYITTPLVRFCSQLQQKSAYLFFYPSADRLPTPSLIVERSSSSSNTSLNLVG